MFAYYVFRAAALLLGFALLVCVPAGLLAYLIATYLGGIGLCLVLAAGAGVLLYLARSIRLKLAELRLVGEPSRR
jgi:hypothetical protein